jgi:hypothetical protein
VHDGLLMHLPHAHAQHAESKKQKLSGGDSSTMDGKQHMLEHVHTAECSGSMFLPAMCTMQLARLQPGTSTNHKGRAVLILSTMIPWQHWLMMLLLLLLL